MEGRFKIITGTAAQVEAELNKLDFFNDITIEGMSATNESTTVIVKVHEE